MSHNSFTEYLALDIRPPDPEGTVNATLQVRDGLKQPMGLVHGGIYAAVAEEVASTSTFLAVSQQGSSCVGQSNLTHFLKPVTDGSLHVTAQPFHRGRTTWVWDVEMRDDNGRLCATSRVTMAIRAAGPDGAPAGK